MAFYDTIITEHNQDLWISTIFILITVILGELVRFILKYSFKDTPDSFLKKVLCELFAAGELCACCFELCVIFENYNIWAYAIELFLLCIWWSFRWGDATACPYTHIEDFMQGQTKLKHVLIIILIQLLGGCASYPFYVKKYWMLKFESKHGERLVANQCSADLTVPVMYGAFIEGFATCMCQLTGRVMSQLNPIYGNTINSFVGTSLVVAAFDMSGGYFNPVLATALQYNCGDISRADHFKVYWGGAIAGSVLSVLIWHSTTLSRKLLPAERPKIE